MGLVLTTGDEQSTQGGLTPSCVTDWYIPEDQDVGVICYPGAIKATGDLLLAANILRADAVWRHSQEQHCPPDWQYEYNGINFRVHRQGTVGGTIYILRRISTNLPKVEDIGLPDEVLRLLTWRNFGDSGGLVLVSGGPGHGKSTTCAALVLGRVRRFGHFCLTVEDPPEFALHGEYLSLAGPLTQIIQVSARSESFAFDLKDSLRCYPSNVKGSMLMVGEVRDGGAAAQLLRAAVNGQLVFTTVHASDPIAALERILSLAKEEMGSDEARSLLAHSLRAVLHQSLEAGRLDVTHLFSMNSTSSVASRIKGGNLALLSTDLEAQKTQLARRGLIQALTGQGRNGNNK